MNLGKVIVRIMCDFREKFMHANDPCRMKNEIVVDLGYTEDVSASHMSISTRSSIYENDIIEGVVDKNALIV